MACAAPDETARLETQLAEAVDLKRPWDLAKVDDELIVHLPLLEGRIETVATLLADKPPAQWDAEPFLPFYLE